jgi:hypothetical protein
MGFIFASWPLAGATWLLFLGEAFFDDIRILRGRAPMPPPGPDPETHLTLGQSPE